MDSTTLKTADLSSADWTENFSSSTPTSYYEHYTSNYDGNMVPFKNSSNGLWFDLDDFTGKVVGTLDLQNAGLMSANANDNYWTLRFKINFSGLTNGTGSMWVGLSNNTDASRDTQKFVGVRFKSNSAGFATGASRYTGGSALSGSSGENETGSTASTYSTGTDYYITVMRTSSTTLKAEIRTGSHTGTLLGTSTDTIYAQTGLRYFKVMNNRLSSGTGGQHKGYIYDVEFHDNEANADGCKNDASSTSELDGMTNLPVNTIFEQTDDTPSYWWKQSDNTWSLDGTSEWTPTTWETDGSQITESSNTVTMNITTRSTNHAVTSDIGKALSDDTWVMRSKVIFTTLTNGGGSTVYLELGVGSKNADTNFANGGLTLDFIGLQMRTVNQDHGWGLVAYDSSGSLNNPESPEMDTDQTTGTYYVEIKRTSNTAMSIGLYSDSGYSTLVMPVETKAVGTGVTGLRYLRVGNAGMVSESSTGNVIAGTVSDIKIQDGVTEWVG
jgi:hypothetical protein